MKSRIAIIGIFLLLWCAAAPAQEKAEYSIESAKSKLEIKVDKEGVFKAFAHNHVIVARQMSGGVQFDARKIETSAVTLKVGTKSLTVAGQESEKDRLDVQANMSGEKVLDVAKYPEITFSSTGVSALKPAADGWTLTVSGKLKLHGVEKPVTFPIDLHVKGNQLQAQGEVSLLQSEYGITPIKVGGGAVTVKDRLKISFDIIAAKTTP